MTGKLTKTLSSVIKRTRLCAYCGELHEMNKRAKYCSKACKQAAYRARQTTPMERAIAKADRYRRMVATKAATIIVTRCCGCGCEMTVTGIQGRGKMYHNRSCKQAAYRARRVERDAIRDNGSRDNS